MLAGPTFRRRAEVCDSTGEDQSPRTTSFPTTTARDLLCTPVPKQQATEIQAIGDDGNASTDKPANRIGELRVIHFCAGYVGPDQLATAARWAIDNYEQATSEVVADPINSEPDAIAEFLQIAHADACSENHLSDVESLAHLLRNSGDELDIASPSDVRKLLQATLTFCESEFKSGELDRDDLPDAALQSLTLSTNTNVGHLALVHLPGITLDQLEQHCFEIVAHGQCYSTETPRVLSLDKFFREAAADGQGVLCCIRESITDAENDPRLTEILALPSVERRLHVVESVPMLEAQLSAIQHRRRRRAVALKADGEVVFALFDTYGDLNAAICDSESVAKVLGRRLDEIGRVAKRNRNLKTKQ